MSVAMRAPLRSPAGLVLSGGWRHYRRVSGVVEGARPIVFGPLLVNGPDSGRMPVPGSETTGAGTRTTGLFVAPAPPGARDGPRESVADGVDGVRERPGLGRRGPDGFGSGFGS
ncbi:hypothetical protein GCM10022206_82420 [Streptomyces chiangmaiensis]